MRLALALLAGIAMAADDLPRLVVPNSPDLTITTRMGSPGDPSRHTVTLRLKGARQRLDRTFESAPGTAPTTFTIIAQCDRRQRLVLNPERRTYAYVPIEDPATYATSLRSGSPTSVHRTERSSGEEIVIDAVDTGERRPFAGLTARHVITTTTTTMTKMAGEPSPRSTRVVDGWYLDLPPFDCIERGDTVNVAFAVGGIGALPASPTVTWLGRAKRGVALIETDRTRSPTGEFGTTTELVAISNAPVDAAVFDVPAGYRGALPYWGGGFDLDRPDTYGNRLALLWEGVRGFAARWWP